MYASGQQIREKVFSITDHQEMWIETTMICHLTPVRMAVIKKIERSVGKDMEKREPRSTVMTLLITQVSPIHYERQLPKGLKSRGWESLGPSWRLDITDILSVILLILKSFYILYFHNFIFVFSLASLIAQLIKNLPAMRETWLQSLGWKDPLEKRKATHSSILAWRIPWGCKSWDWVTSTFSPLCICCWFHLFLLLSLLPSFQFAVLFKKIFWDKFLHHCFQPSFFKINASKALNFPLKPKYILFLFFQ